MTSLDRIRLAPRPTAFAVLAFVLAGLASGAGAASAAEHRIGIGLLYFDATDDLGNGGIAVNDDGTAFVLSYQYRPAGLLKFELDLEVAPDGYGGSNETTYSPVAWVLVGKGLYGGVGVGVSFASDFRDDVSDPFFAARVGFNLLLFPRTRLDLNVNYRADAFNELDNVDSDALTLGAILRFTLKG